MPMPNPFILTGEAWHPGSECPANRLRLTTERWSMLSVQEDVALDLDIALENECSLEETFQETKQKMKRKCLQRYKHMSVVRCKYFPFTRKNIVFQAWKSRAWHEYDADDEMTN